MDTHVLTYGMLELLSKDGLYTSCIIQNDFSDGVPVNEVGRLAQSSQIDQENIVIEFCRM